MAINNIGAIKVGVLGGGQLGKMLGIAAAPWHLSLRFLDQSPDFPAGIFPNTISTGDFNHYDDVLRFGSDLDIITIEIEHVNTEALHELKRRGKTVHPNPSALEIIKDKGLQKQFYTEHGIPTAPFRLFENAGSILEALKTGTLQYPFVQKSRTAGYDGKGVAVIDSREDLNKLMDTPSVIEEKIPIQKELSVIVARNQSGQISSYPAVEMLFHPEANLVEYMACPAAISPDLEAKAQALGQKIMEKFGICGLLAVEMFLDHQGALLVNEVAPRPHNSGHHTIDSSVTSQFEQHLRAILNMPLGATNLLTPAVTINLLGAPGFSGQVFYQGIEACMEWEGVYLHLYGKQDTKPYRKMGHATVVGQTVEAARQKASKVKETLKIISQ